VLAVCERERLPGEAAMRGIAIGVELMCRASLVAPKLIHKAGFHPTAVLGAMAAAAGVASALELPRKQFVNALGIAGSMAGGIIEYLAEGAWTKRLHPGWAAQSGIRAADLARQGFTGPRTVFEGTHGLYHGFARTTQGILEGGARLELATGWVAGAQLAYEAGPRDGDPGASLGLHMELDTKIGPAPLNLLARTRTHLDSDRGSQADARLTLGVYRSGGLQAGVFGQATWASGKHMRAYYGVGDAGLLFTSLGLLGSHDLARHWVAVASAELRRLASEPSRSGFVQDRTSHYLSAGVAYRF